MNFFKRNNSLKQTLLSMLLLLIIVITANFALLKNVVYESDDYLHHAARTANYYLALKQGQFPVRWAPNLNNSYGYPAFNYTYHVPYAVGSIFHFLNFSIQQSLNLSVLLAAVIGSLTTFALVKSYKVSNMWSALLSLVYIFNPYTLLSIYWRGAIGELYFYAFIPLLFLSVRKLLVVKEKNRKWVLYFFTTSLTTALLITSHLPSIILLIPLLIVFIFSETKWRFNIQQLLPTIVAGLIGFLISSWYWIPAYFEQWMIVYQSGNSLTQYSDQFANIINIFDISKTFNSSDNFINVIQIGGVQLLAIFIGFYLLKFSKKTLAWIITSLVAVFFLSDLSSIFWDNSKILQYIQYPWRTLWIVTISSILILVAFINEKKVLKQHKQVVAILVLVTTLFSMQAYITTKGSTSRTDFDWYQTFATASSFDEHRPIWSNTPYEFSEELLYLNTNDVVQPLSALNPDVTSKTGSKIEYTLTSDQDITTIYKRLFYPGWEAYLDGEKIEFIENIPEYEGVLAVNLPAGESKVSIVFTGFTILRRTAEILSLIGLFGLVVFTVMYKPKDK